MYAEIIVRMVDSFMYFVYGSYKRTKLGGCFGMILPDVILYQKDNEKLRSLLLRNTKIEAILNLGDVFDKVTRPASILVLKKSTANKNKITVADFSGLDKSNKPKAILDRHLYNSIDQKDVSTIPGELFLTREPVSYLIWKKISLKQNVLLKNLVDEDGIQRGVSPDLKKAFIVDGETVRKNKLERNKLRPVLTGGKHVKRYYLEDQDLWLIYTLHTDNPREFPNICDFINKYRHEITCPEVKENKHPFYSLHRPREERIFLKPEKLLGVITEDEIKVALDNSSYFATDGLYVFGTNKNVDVHYLMSILNSSLFIYIYRLFAFEKNRVLAQVKPSLLNELPIRTMDLSNLHEKDIFEHLVSLARTMVRLSDSAHKLKGLGRDQIQHQIEKTDREIDDLVYKLYGITDEERRIIEEEKS